MCSAVGVLSPEAGGLCEGVMVAEVIPLMSMVGEVREERGVSMVDGMVEMGGDLDLPLADETSSVAKEGRGKCEILISKNRRLKSEVPKLVHTYTLGVPTRAELPLVQLNFCSL